MNYKQSFKDLLNFSLNHDEYVGLGNPNANILFVGKEPGFDPLLQTDIALDHQKNASEWTKSDRYAQPFTPAKEQKNLRNRNHTWQIYQKLHDFIFESQPPHDYRITFVEKVFTTEMSNLPADRTLSARKQPDFKDNLEKRKKLFFTSQFINEFPVVVLACSDYIRNRPGEWQINDLFGVQFHEERQCSPKNSFWIHYSNDQRKLVIHTRQLSNGVSDVLLKEMANEIRGHLIRHNLSPK